MPDGHENVAGPCFGLLHGEIGRRQELELVHIGRVSGGGERSPASSEQRSQDAKESEGRDDRHVADRHGRDRCDRHERDWQDETNRHFPCPAAQRQRRAEGTWSGTPAPEPDERGQPYDERDADGARVRMAQPEHASAADDQHHYRRNRRHIDGLGKCAEAGVRHREPFGHGSCGDEPAQGLLGVRERDVCGWHQEQEGRQRHQDAGDSMRPFRTEQVMRQGGERRADAWKDLVEWNETRELDRERRRDRKREHHDQPTGPAQSLQSRRRKFMRAA